MTFENPTTAEMAEYYEATPARVPDAERPSTVGAIVYFSSMCKAGAEAVNHPVDGPRFLARAVERATPAGEHIPLHDVHLHLLEESPAS